MGVLDRLARFFWKEFEKAITQPLKAKRVSQKQQKTKHASYCREEGFESVPRPRGGYGGVYDKDYELRLVRARTEPMEIIAYGNEEHTLARIKSGTSEMVYTVTDTTCGCGDYRKRWLPCKHMIFLALKNGQYKKAEIVPPDGECHRVNEDGMFVPCYWKYYRGAPVGIGYTNLQIFQVKGYTYKTTKKGERRAVRKEGIVYATGEEDAKKAAEEKEIMPPYESVEPIDTCPSPAQYQYLHGAGIPIPYFINASDASALLTRYEDADDEICPEYLFKMATKRRVRVSYFQSPASVKSCIWDAAPEEKRVALYCYAVYCKEKEAVFGRVPSSDIDDAVFSGFQPTENEREYILSIYEFGWRQLRKNANAYKRAVAHLRNSGML